MKLGSTDPGVERVDFVGRGVLLEDADCECLAVARFGVLVGVSCRWVETARVLLERSGVALSVCSWTISPSEPSKSRSLCGSLAEWTESASEE
jgi:hypothetical protein